MRINGSKKFGKWMPLRHLSVLFFLCFGLQLVCILGGLLAKTVWTGTSSDIPGAGDISMGNLPIISNYNSLISVLHPSFTGFDAFVLAITFFVCAEISRAYAEARSQVQVLQEEIDLTV